MCACVRVHALVHACLCIYMQLKPITTGPTHTNTIFLLLLILLLSSPFALQAKQLKEFTKADSR